MKVGLVSIHISPDNQKPSDHRSQTRNKQVHSNEWLLVYRTLQSSKCKCANNISIGLVLGTNEDMLYKRC